MLEGVGTIQTFRDGEVIFRENQPGQTMYVIESGSVRLTRTNIRESEDVVTDVALLRQGDFLGEMALFDHGPRSATATAQGDVILRKISRKELETEERQNPDVAFVFLERMSRRMRRTDSRIEKLLVNEHLAGDVYDQMSSLRYSEHL